MPGSLVSTRSSRRPAAADPSATLTCPACSELPIPTPPPWWNDTQPAPDAVLSNALRSGQSAIASDPSRIASVSRKGDATEPVSRWTRPITTGAATSPRLPSSRGAGVPHCRRGREREGGRDVAVERIVRGGLIGHHVGSAAAPDGLGEHLRAFGHEPHRERPTVPLRLFAPAQGLFQRVGGAID